MTTNVTVTVVKGAPADVSIRQLPVVGRSTSPPAPLRKIAIEEHFIDPALAHSNHGDSFSGEFAQQGSSYAGFPGFLSDAEQGAGVLVEDGPGVVRVDLGVVDVVDRADEGVPVFVGEVGSEEKPVGAE